MYNNVLKELKNLNHSEGYSLKPGKYLMANGRPRFTLFNNVAEVAKLSNQQQFI